MDDTSKYLIHAAITADGVVERSDVVGAIFGQTEGLLGDDLDLRDLQQSSKVGRIDVEISSEGGQSFGEVTIASSLDRVETAILAASLETISRVGPCRARVEVTEIEDVREVKRREVVERAKELLAESFDDGVMTSGDILRQVREAAQVEDIDEYEGLPAGPRVADSDAVIVVEGRADVLALLDYGIKNAVAVEGTDVPDAVADLTQNRTVTAFLDDDRGGELILRELAQVGDVDYVAFAPGGQSVEDLDRSEVMAALREKVPHDRLPTDGNRRAAAAEWADDEAGDAVRPRTGPPGTEGPAAGISTTDDASDPPTDRAPAARRPGERTPNAGAVEDAVENGKPENGTGGDDDATDEADDGDARGTEVAAGSTADGAIESDADRTDGTAAAGTDRSAVLREQVAELVDGETERVRLLDADLTTLAEADAAAAFETLDAADEAPNVVVLDGELSQRLLDLAAQVGVDQVVARSTGEFVKQPVGVRVRTADRVTA